MRKARPGQCVQGKRGTPGSESRQPPGATLIRTHPRAGSRPFHFLSCVVVLHEMRQLSCGRDHDERFHVHNRTNKTCWTKRMNSIYLGSKRDAQIALSAWCRRRTKRNMCHAGTDSRDDCFASKPCLGALKTQRKRTSNQRIAQRP